MFVKYNCPICAGVHTIETGDARATQVMDELMTDAASRFASSVVKALGWGKDLKAKRAQGHSNVISQRQLKLSIRDLMNMHPKTPLASIPGVEAALPKMVGALIVEHTDGKRSLLIAESGKPELLTDRDVFNGWQVATGYIVDSLPSVFASRSLSREAHFPTMSEEDFNTNCAAIKLLMAVAKDRKRVRDRMAKLTWLESTAPIKSLNLSEMLYRPPGVKIAQGFRKFASAFDKESDDLELLEDFQLATGEVLQAEQEHFARPCDRCRLKAPVIICPIESRLKKTLFEEAQEFEC